MQYIVVRRPHCAASTTGKLWATVDHYYRFFPPKVQSISGEKIAPSNIMKGNRQNRSVRSLKGLALKVGSRGPVFEVG